MAGLIVSHDLGTTGDKATLVDAAGHVVAAMTATYRTDFGPRGKAEQDPESWWAALCSATRRLIESAAVPAGDVAAVSFSGQMMGAVPLDERGEPVRPAIIWADTRAKAQSDQLVARIGMDEGYRITGHRFNPTYTLAKVMLLRDTEPAAFERTRHVVMAKDFAVYRLTGVLATDPSDASGTNAFDQGKGRWSPEILDAAGLDHRLFPDILPSVAIAGHVTAGAAEATGLLAGTPVVMGGGDGPMGALGAGIVDGSCGAYAYLGSSSWVSLAADAPLHDPQMRSMTFNHVIPGRFVPTATMQAGGASLEWITGVLAPGEAGRYERLLGDAAGVAACDDGLYFLPHLLGERSPYWNPRARAVFAGLARHHGPAHLARAVVEGVGFNLYTGLQAFLDSGAVVDRVDAIGGAANSALVLQIFADTWGVPVGRRDLVDEATALGAAIVGGVGVGVFPGFDVARDLSRRTAEYLPDPARHRRLLAAHSTFLDAYRRLEPWFETL